MVPVLRCVVGAAGNGHCWDRSGGNQFFLRCAGDCCSRHCKSQREPGAFFGQNSPGNPSAGQGIGTNNVNTAMPNPSIAPTIPNQPAAGNQPRSGAQPGQTGSMESQRLNSLNRSYQSQQQRALSAERQRLNGPMQTGISGSGRVVDRQSAAADLRRLGLATEDWRIVNQNGRWWFWTPNKSWMYFDNGSWRDYRANNLGLAISGDRRTVTFPPGYAPEDWRLVFHANRWWFWTPNESWMYFDHGRWNDYRASGPVVTRGQAENQYRVGYRGTNAGSTSPSTVQVPGTNNDSRR